METPSRFDVFSIRETQTESGQSQSWWTRVGRAFRNRDGSINVHLDALPMQGKLQLREPSEPRNAAN